MRRPFLSSMLKNSHCIGLYCQILLSEIAGKWIEYGWALLKLKCRSFPITWRWCTKDGLCALVRKCMDNIGVLSFDKIRSCNKMVRDEMFLYKKVEAINFDEMGGSDTSTPSNKHSILEHYEIIHFGK